MVSVIRARKFNLLKKNQISLPNLMALFRLGKNLKTTIKSSFRKSSSPDLSKSKPRFRDRETISRKTKMFYLYYSG